VRKSAENKTKKQSDKTAKTVAPKSTEAVITAEVQPEAKEEAKTETKAEAVVEAMAGAKDEAKTEVKVPAKRGRKPADPAAKAAKEAAKKATKAAAVKEPVAKKEVKTSEVITLQVDGRDDLSMNTLIDRVKAAYVAEGHKAASIKNVEVYVKLSENMAYYVIDGYASGISLY
jgi:membrane protein involved in colicin uptake